MLSDWGAYIWRGLFSEFYGIPYKIEITICYPPPPHMFPVEVVRKIYSSMVLIKFRQLAKILATLR